MAEVTAPGAKTFDLAEVSLHQTEKDCWMAINGKVYNVTDFLDEHPGGYDIVVSNSGKDATEDFEEIGHSKTAKDMLKEYYVGEFVGGALPVKTKKQNGTLAGSTTGTTSLSTALLRAVLPLLVLALAILYALNR
ncbi:CYB1 [Auxenochlorella protothecoides x Auxenochlorella symbiontica]